jgi:hypothetical protein
VSENVADEAAIESPETPEGEPEATPATDELTTIKNRLAGKDKALTRIQQERDAAKAELDALRQWKAEKEEASLTELEKLTKRLADAEREKAEAIASAERIRLEKSYPDAVSFYGDDPLPNEDRLQALQERLAAVATPGDDEEPEPRIDPNRPRRTGQSGVKSNEDKSVAELAADLRGMGNPFYDNPWARP